MTFRERSLFWFRLAPLREELGDSLGRILQDARDIGSEPSGVWVHHGPVAKRLPDGATNVRVEDGVVSYDLDVPLAPGIRGYLIKGALS